MSIINDLGRVGLSTRNGLKTLDLELTILNQEHVLEAIGGRFLSADGFDLTVILDLQEIQWCRRINLESLLFLCFLGYGLTSFVKQHGKNKFVERKPLPKNLIPVPLYLQKTSYSCGPSSALSLLRYWEWKTYAHVPEKDLYARMNCSADEGTDPGPIANFFNVYANIPATYVNGSNITLSMLEKAIDDKKPPMVDLQAWSDGPVNWKTDWDDGHYNVLVGYDETNFFFMDPSTDHTYAFIPKDEFFIRWHDVEGTDNHKVYHMVIFIEGTQTRHPVNPKHPYATKED